MAGINHFTLTLPAVATPLGSLLATPGAASDIPYRTLIFSGETGNNAGGIKLGGPTVSATDYGVVIPNTVATLVVGSYEAGPLKLSAIWAFPGAANDKLHVCGVPY